MNTVTSNSVFYSMFSLLLLVPLFVYPQINPEKEIETSQQKTIFEETPESEQDRIFRKDTILQINEILQKVQKHYPSLAKRLSDQDKENIFKSLVKTLDCGMEYTPALKQKKQQQEKPDTIAYPAIIIAKHKVLYVRIDSFSKEAVKQLQTDCVSSFRLSNSPVGVILDLRSAQNYNCLEALKALGLFNLPDNIPLPEGEKSLQKIVNCPVMILTGKNTKGAPEIFAMLMTKLQTGILLGEKTAGDPFEKQQIHLSNGDFLIIPIVPEYLDYIKPMPLIPAINYAAYPQIAFQKLRKEAGSEISDKCLRRAIDLIICLKALSPEKN